MKIYIKAISLGVITFYLLNIVVMPLGLMLENLGLMGLVLTFSLLASGFIAGKIALKKGFWVGIFTGITIYIVALLSIGVIVLFMILKYGPAEWDGNPNGLFTFTKNFSWIVFSASFITGIGGFIGSYLSNLYKLKK